MKYWMTQSLLSSWIYFLSVKDECTQQAWDSFVSTLRKEKKDKSKEMKEGILFEDLVNRLASGQVLDGEFNAKWESAARRFAAKCFGGQSQVPVTDELSVCGMDFVLYGVCDYVKAGVIYDIKKVTRYEYGKYFRSPQHSMYLRLIPGAKKFEYLIFDGSNCHIETYRREDCKPIDQTITEFIRFLKFVGLLETYQKFWTMNQERQDKRSSAV